MGDAAWLARYARNREGEALPWALLQEEIQETHAYEVGDAEGGGVSFLASMGVSVSLSPCFSVCPSLYLSMFVCTSPLLSSFPPCLPASLLQVFTLRSMLAVPYFEKRLYELPDDEVTPARLLQLASDVEVDIQGSDGRFYSVALTD